MRSAANASKAGTALTAGTAQKGSKMLNTATNRDARNRVFLDVMLNERFYGQVSILIDPFFAYQHDTLEKMARGAVERRFPTLRRKDYHVEISKNKMS